VRKEAKEVGTIHNISGPPTAERSEVAWVALSETNALAPKEPKALESSG